MLRFNLHNHSHWSDGEHAPRALAEKALAEGLSHLGICDHFRSTKLPAEQSVALDRVEAYAAELKGLAGEFEGRLRLLSGLEVNFSLIQTDLSFLSRFEPRDNPFNELDFVLFEYVNDSEWFGLGIEELLRIRPFFSLPVGLAHNDLDRNFSGAVEPATLALLLARSDIFVELCPTRRNSRLGPDGGEAWLPYYRVESPFMSRFWQAAQAEGLLLSIGCDVHGELEEVARVEDAARFLEERGLEQQSVLTLWGKA